MKIKSIEINNFRSIKSDKINCVDFNTFVGPNGSGKSTVLNALNVFFGEINSFSEDDFHVRDTSQPIKIRITFDELSEAAEEEFKHYVRSGLLIVQAEIARDEKGNFNRTIRGERLIFEPFKIFFEAKTASDRGKVFKALKDKFDGIEDATNDAGRKASLLAYEERLDDDEKVLTASGAEFFGISKGTHKFQKHVSWVYVPAVKDASSEAEEGKSSHLGRLIQHTIRSGMDYNDDLEKIKSEALKAYEELLYGQRLHLSSLQKRLAERLQSAVTAETNLALDWKMDEKSVAVQDPVAQVLLSDRGFSGEVDKFGHGLQRAFLLVILQELMAVDSNISPTLILGCEEPELYQHPPQERHLAQILMELSEGDAQILLTTHSPYFIDVEHYDGIKMFRNTAGLAKSSCSSFETILAGYNAAFTRPLRNEDQARTKLAIQTQPKFNEVFFAEKVVLLEGICDLACFETYLRLSGRRPEFQKSGAAMVVCDGKSSLALMALIAKDFDVPFHVVFDCDANCAEQHRESHIRDNDAIMQLAGYNALGDFSPEHIFKSNLTGWFHTIDQVLEAEYGDGAVAFNQAGSDAVGNLRNSKKHPLHVAAAMKAAWEDGRRFSAFEKVVDQILS